MYKQTIARVARSKDSDALKVVFKEFPQAGAVIEGHCDERGSAEYNVALRDRRANEAKAFLAQFGISPERLELISYRKERPQWTSSNEDCWRRNRRVHFVSSQ